MPRKFSIFEKYSVETKSQKLWEEIKFVLDNFALPFTELFKSTLELAKTQANNKENLKIIFGSLLLISKIFYFLNYQDLPEFFEDNMQVWMNGFQVIMPKCGSWCWFQRNRTLWVQIAHFDLTSKAHYMFFQCFPFSKCTNTIGVQRIWREAQNFSESDMKAIECFLKLAHFLCGAKSFHISMLILHNFSGETHKHVKSFKKYMFRIW